MADRNRYTRRGRYQDLSDRGDRSWREQEEQLSNERGMQPDYEEGYGSQMSEPYAGSYSQRQGDYETGWDHDSRYGQRNSGYSRGDYQSSGEYNYGPARFDTAPGWRGSSFTSEDQGGRDFTAPARRYYGSGAQSNTGAFFGSSGLFEGTGAYDPRGRSRHARGYDRNSRDWFDRAGDEVMSWFGDKDAARRRQMDHSGRGPQNYTRSDERIREDVNDNLTDDWAVDARNVTVSVSNGDVTLDGTVATRLQKRRAEDCAEDVSGVRNVQNNLRIQERTSSDESSAASSATSSTRNPAKSST